MVGPQALLLLLVLSSWTSAAPRVTDHFFYQEFLKGKGDKDIHSGAVKLRVASAQLSVLAVAGANTTLPCKFWYEPEQKAPREVRVKWSRLPIAGGPKTDVLVAIGPRIRTLGEFRGRVWLRQDFPGDAALKMTDLQLNDTGCYVCEVVDGLEDQRAAVDLELQGVVFPYQHPGGRYYLSFLEAQRACKEQDSTLATFSQLLKAWKEGLDWCNAGWLADGTAQYPITRPRVPCGGQGLAPGIRSYGRRRLHLHRYDVFCFSSSLRGKVYFLESPRMLNLTEARQACKGDEAQIAKVGQLYAAWKLAGLDRCDGGWLADGSVRYPIMRPRRNCGTSEPGVRSFGFPPPQLQYGVYCYKPED